LHDALPISWLTAVNFKDASLESGSTWMVTSRTATLPSSLSASEPSTAATWLEVWVIWPAEQDASASAAIAVAEMVAPLRVTDFRDITSSVLHRLRSRGLSTP